MESANYTDFYPSFIEKHTLKPRQLELVRDFPREMETLRYADYADGILFGCRVSAGKEITVSPGVVLREGFFFRMTSPVSVPYSPSEDIQYLKIRFAEEVLADEDISERNAKIVLDGELPGENETELARFNLKEGARLRSDYTGFNDLDTEFDTLCPVHSPCAAPFGETLLPFVTTLFAKEMLSRKPETREDVMFAYFCLGAERVSRDILQDYLCTESIKPSELYGALKEKLASIRTGISVPDTKRIIRKIAVD
jgi:hypothetical protein